MQIARFVFVNTLAIAALLTCVAGDCFAGPTTQPVGISQFDHVGDGPIPMVLVPGFSCDSSAFAEYMARNAATYSMYAVTLPGFGGTAAPPLPAADDQRTVLLDNAADAIVQFVREHKLDRPVLLGHSMGGMLAMRLVADQPEVFRAVVLVDCMPAFPPGPPGETADARRERMWKALGGLSRLSEEQWNANRVISAKALVTGDQRAGEVAQMGSKVPKDVAVRYLAEVSSVDYRDRAKRIATPALLLAAVAPSTGSTEQIEAIWSRVAKLIPGCKLVIFRNTRHFIFFDRPAEFDSAVSRFIAGEDPTGVVEPATLPAK